MSESNPIEYNSIRSPRVSRMAITAMILSIFGVATMCFLIGIPIVMLGLILGIVALLKINSRPLELAGKGYALAAIITGGAGCALLIPLMLILLPSLGRARELANRSYCAANLRGIAQSMNVYAADNSDAFPVVPYAPYGPGNYAITPPRGDAVVGRAIEAMYKPSAPEDGSPLASVWIMVMKNQVSPKQFICKSDPWAKSPASQTDPTGAFFTNFQRDDQISYSFDYPYTSDGTVGQWWKNLTDTSLPIASDMAPLNGTGSPRRDLTTSMAPSNPKTWNSANHQGDGQNVAFSDAHVEFTRRPDVGPNNDNIFTWGAAPRRGGVEFGGTAPGKSPISITTETAPFDTVMVPARNLDTGGL